MNITALIEKSGLSRKQVCERSGVSRSMLSLIESGKRQVSPERAQKLAAVLGVTVEELRPDLAALFCGSHPAPTPTGDAA
ncbi:helix-turn-helix domain-containing protein [Rhodovulum kholense]|uniref:Helix-turn-helix protein n=1 Tax=Rhodovulum kholense TaxID=453584 RepID=A0A8E3APX8_9RHOB|nr:helix-turn-helix transcriptional regulator [Rhodovulum kholense]PTW45674.1 helix-turn-helix protein [Rhodovulum kholense]